MLQHIPDDYNINLCILPTSPPPTKKAYKREMLLRGAWTISTPPTCSPTSSASASDVLFDVIRSCSALSGPENDGQRFMHPQSIIHTDIEREVFGRCMTTFWRRIVDEQDAFPPEFW